MKLAGRKIRFLSCQVDPQISRGKMPKLSFAPKDYGAEAWFTEGGHVIVKLDNGNERVIGVGNIRGAELEPEEMQNEVAEIRRGPGRPPRSGAI